MAYAWIVIFVALVLGHYRTAQAIAALAIVPDLLYLLHAEFTGIFEASLGLVGLLDPAQSYPCPGYDRVPPGRPGGRTLALAAGNARQLPPGARAADGTPGDWQLRLAARLGRAGLRPGRPRLPGTRARRPGPATPPARAWSLALTLLAADAAA